MVNSSPLTFLNGCVARLFVFTMGKRIALVVGGVFVVVLMAVMMVQQASAVCSVPLTTGTGGGT